MAEQTPPSDNTGGDARPHILLVDDEDMITDMAKDALEDRGYSVSVFNNPEVALGAFRNMSRNVDLILVDHAMPEMSGIQLAEECRSLNPDIPIVMATGYAAGIDESRMTEGMFAAILEKPYRLKALCEVIDQILG
ncbi:MAG: response regulator [Gemmatimonadota bacterium]|nr:response regulator [Gemmatimonadota bacterium]